MKKAEFPVQMHRLYGVASIPDGGYEAKPLPKNSLVVVDEQGRSWLAEFDPKDWKGVEGMP